jgi:hypothetical protein
MTDLKLQLDRDYEFFIEIDRHHSHYRNPSAEKEILIPFKKPYLVEDIKQNK